MRSLLALFVLCAACSSEPAEVELYEDLSAGGGKEDGASLTPQLAVIDLAPTWDERVTTTRIGSVLGDPITAGTPLVAIRTLRLDDVAALVVVDADTLAVAVVGEDALDRGTRAAGPGELVETRYRQALERGRGQTFRALAPDGATRFAVTVDMCQSSRGWEVSFFRALVELGRVLGAPLPVGVAMTGGWANAHRSDFAQLVDWDRRGELRITWINHSYSHPVKDREGHYTFLTDPRVDLSVEVLRLEALLIGQKLVPSPLFRFPGLTWNPTRLIELNDLSLLGLDASAWLAKGEPIADETVVLLHGNGNEHVGITMWDDELDTWRPRLIAGTATIAPILDVVP